MDAIEAAFGSLFGALKAGFKDDLEYSKPTVLAAIKQCIKKEISKLDDDED